MRLDTSHAKSRVEAIRQKVAGPEEKRSDELTPEDRNAIIGFDEQLVRERRRNNRCGWMYHANLLTELFVFGTETQVLADILGDDEEAEQAVDTLTEWIHDQESSGYTIQSRLSTIRVFASTMLEGDLPEHIADIEPSEYVDDDRAPLPSEVIRYNRLVDMVEASTGTRDKALLATQWDGGMRPMKELYLLQRKHVTLADDHVVITLEKEHGKSERRDLLLLVGGPYLRKWIEEDHPIHDDPEDEMSSETFLWTHRDQNELLSYNAMAERFREAGARVGLEMEASPQHFRRSSASVLAGQPFINERDLRYQYDWAPTSPAPEHYIAAFDDATKVNVARSRGREVEDIGDSPDIAAVPCPRCGDWTMRGLQECIWCHHNLEAEQQTFEPVTMGDPRAAEKKPLSEMILDGDITADELATLSKVEHVVKTEHNLWDELDELQQKARALEESREESGGTVKSVTGLAGAAGYASAFVGGLAKRWAHAKHAAFTIHPGFEDYPPDAKTAGKVAAGWALVLGVCLLLAWNNVILEAALNGDPTAIAGSITGLAVGIGMVVADMPTVDEAVEELADET